MANNQHIQSIDYYHAFNKNKNDVVFFSFQTIDFSPISRTCDLKDKLQWLSRFFIDRFRTRMKEKEIFITNELKKSIGTNIES